MHARRCSSLAEVAELLPQPMLVALSKTIFDLAEIDLDEMLRSRIESNGRVGAFSKRAQAAACPNGAGGGNGQQRAGRVLLFSALSFFGGGPPRRRLGLGRPLSRPVPSRRRTSCEARPAQKRLRIRRQGHLVDRSPMAVGGRLNFAFGGGFPSSPKLGFGGGAAADAARRELSTPTWAVLGSSARQTRKGKSKESKSIEEKAFGTDWVS